MADRIKPAEAADRAAEAQSDVARAAERRWWRLVPRVVTHPHEVFVALRNDDDTDVNARSEPILAIVILAGVAGILLTPAWGTYLDDQSLDWVTLAVVTFIGGLLYGAFGYLLLGLALWLGLRGAGVETRARTVRQVLAFSALPLALSLLVTLPAVLFAFGYDWFRTGGSDTGAGRDLVLAAGAAFAVWAIVLLALGLRTTFRVAWQGVAGAMALAAVMVAVVAVVPTVL